MVSQFQICNECKEPVAIQTFMNNNSQEFQCTEPKVWETEKL